mgnify:CR=1 FL=1
MKNAAASAEKVAPLKAAYDEALQTLKAYQNQLAAAQAKLASMKGETPTPEPDQPTKPDDTTKPGDTTKPSEGSDKTETTTPDKNGVASWLHWCKGR